MDGENTCQPSVAARSVGPRAAQEGCQRSRYIRIRLASIRISTRFFLALFVLLAAFLAVGVLGLGGLREVQRVNEQVFSDNLLTDEVTSELTIDLADTERIGLEIAAADKLEEADALKAQLDQIAIPRVNQDLARFLAIHAHDPRAEAAGLRRIPAEWNAAALSPTGPLRTIALPVVRAQRVRAAAAIANALDPLIRFVSGRRAVERAAASAAHARAEATYGAVRRWLILSALVALLASAIMLFAGVRLKHLVDRHAEDQEFEASEAEYLTALQVAEHEEEAHQLLRGQVERLLGGSNAVVLVRNNVLDSLEAKTSLAELPQLRSSLPGATPRSCLAVRFGRGHVASADSTALVRCEICGALPGSSTCEPLLVGGEVIGVVLITHADALAETQHQRVRKAVSDAAPVLANLHNLAIAQRQAATDALTGLPNRRAVDDTLTRMVAQSARTFAPLAVLLMDLDHFKAVNDRYGHDRGDQVLTAVGVALRGALRESDFAGRYGGEEFLMLLASTDKQGALRVAESVRGAIATIRLPDIDRITASIGLAVLPDDAGEAVALVRAADRALYAAKRNGRDRVEVVVGELETEAGEALAGS